MSSSCWRLPLFILFLTSQFSPFFPRSSFHGHVAASPNSKAFENCLDPERFGGGPAMAGGEEKKESDLYAVLGLKKECSSTELRSAYKKLAMKWHPDRCSSSGNSNFVDEAKEKFQAIQEAYSVLSDHNKRLLYDVGIYDEDDDDKNNGMGDFLSEMAAMMSQTKPTENGEDTFEEFQDLFDEIFRQGNETFAPTPPAEKFTSPSNNKRSSSQLNYTAGHQGGVGRVAAEAKSACSRRRQRVH